MMSCKVVCVGLAMMPWMLAPALANTHDHPPVRAKRTFTFSITQAAPLAANPRVPVVSMPLSAKDADKPQSVALADVQSALSAAETKWLPELEWAGASFRYVIRAFPVLSQQYVLVLPSDASPLMLVQP